MRSSRGSVKEALGKKASGVGVLVSALHQSASSLVTTRAEHNGPDQLLTATGYLTSRRNGTVKLRREDAGLGAEEPVSIPTMLQRLAENLPEVVAMKSRDQIPGEWKILTYSQMYEQVQVVARAFIETGLHRHHSVGIVADNCQQWVIANMATIMAGGISVGISKSLLPDELAKVCLDSKTDVIVVDNEVQLKKVLLIQHKLPELKAIVQIHGEPSISDKRRLHRTHKKYIISWSALIEIGQGLPDTRLDERLNRIAVNHCCTIAYSTGTNSAPKGMMYSHDNLTWSAKMALGFIRAPGFNKCPMPGEEVLISYLPLAHISTQLIDLYYVMHVAGTLVFPTQNIVNNTDQFFSHIKEMKPTILYGPPAIYERIYHRLIQSRKEASNVERFVLDWSSCRVTDKISDIGTVCNQQSSGGSLCGGPANKFNEIQQKIAKSTVCKKYKEQLGLTNQMVYICRGGHLNTRLLRFLAGFDIVVHSAFGQSEVCSFVTANVPERCCKFSTAGKPVTGVKLKIGSEESNGKGELECYGRNIFMGYINKETDNQNLLNDDNWLKLGEEGSFDSEGFLNVHGKRQDKLEMSNTSVHPAIIEANLRLELPCINSCLVFAHGVDKLGVLLSLDAELDHDSGVPTTTLTHPVIQWFRAARFEVETINDVIEHIETGIKHVLQAGIDRANQHVQSSCQMIGEWRVLPNSFSLCTGELGPTINLRRSHVLGKYAEHINLMLTHEGRKHSFTDSIGGDSFTGYHDPYPHHLHNIIEEEEKSARNSIDKDFSTLERDKIKDDKVSTNKKKISDSNAPKKVTLAKETENMTVKETTNEGPPTEQTNYMDSATTKVVVVESSTIEGTTEEKRSTEEDTNEESTAEGGIHEETSTDEGGIHEETSTDEGGIHEETSTDDSSVSSKSSGIIQQSLESSAAEVNASKRKVSRK